jgi:hypothetical protein
MADIQLLLWRCLVSPEGAAWPTHFQHQAGVSDDTLKQRILQCAVHAGLAKDRSIRG